MSRAAETERVKRNAAIKLRIHPTAAQAELIDKTFDCCRWLWNRMLADEQEFYAATGRHFLPTPAGYKREAPFLKEADSLALATVHQNLRRAFQDFFKESRGYPAFKRRNGGREAYTTFCQYFRSGPTVYLTEEGIRLPKLGIVKAVFHRRPLHWWTLKSATVSKSPSGKYFCSLLYEYSEKIQETAPPERVLKLQSSPDHLYTDAGGGAVDFPPWLEAAQEKLARQEARLARMQPGSGNYEAQLRKIRLQREHIANQKRDFVHKESRRIADAWDAVEAEGSKGEGGTGFGMLRECVAYKLARRGKPFSSKP